MGRSKKKSQQKQQNDWFKDPMAVTWTENYSDVINKYWEKLPQTVGKSLATLAIFALGVSINGKFFILFCVYIFELPTAITANLLSF
jgi:uncharacterized surface anchored protein